MASDHEQSADQQHAEIGGNLDSEDPSEPNATLCHEPSRNWFVNGEESTYGGVRTIGHRRRWLR